MAKDVEDEIKEEEEYEAEDAESIEEQGLNEEFSDEGGENMAVTAKGQKSGVEFICLKCGTRKKGGAGRQPVHCSERMTPVDFISK